MPKPFKVETTKAILSKLKKDGNHDAQVAFAVLVTRSARIANGFLKDDLDHLVLAGLETSPQAARFFNAVAGGFAEIPEMAEVLERAVSVEDEVPKFSVLANKLRNKPDIPLKLFGQSKFGYLIKEIQKQPKPEKKEKGGASHKENEAKDPGGKDSEVSEEERPEPSTTTITTPDGFSIISTGPGKGEGGEDRKEPSEDEIQTRYVEDIESGEPLYAISIHKIKCIEVTDYSLLGLFDDDLAWVAKGTARFKNKTIVPFRVVSSNPHDDVSEDDVLSGLEELVSPSDELNTHLLTRDETFLVNRLRFVGREDLGQGGILMNKSPFVLNDFRRMEMELGLFEDDDDVKKVIGEILNILQQLTDLAATAVQVSGTGGTPVGAVITALQQNQAFTEIDRLIQELIDGQDKIQVRDFIVSQQNIRDAFEKEENVKSLPEFDWVGGRPEQVKDFSGKGAHYQVYLRYERYSAAE